MSEVERFPVEQDNLSALGRWALDASQAYRVAQSLAETSFVPASMHKRPGEITAAILTGQEIGLQPMSALRSIDIISGTPAMRAHALRGLVQSRGHEVWVVESTETRAVVAGRRKGSQQEQRSMWTIDRAAKLQLTSRDQWKRQPQAMLIARATAEVCRLIASDVLLGMPYAVEELDPDPDAAVTPGAGPKRTARRRPLMAPPEPAQVAEEPPPEPVVEAPPPGPSLEPDLDEP